MAVGASWSSIRLEWSSSHSHLNAGGYSYDQKQKGKDVAHAVEFLIQDEKARAFLTSMVSSFSPGRSTKRPCCLSA